MNIDWIAYMAAVCTTISFVPQVLHILQTRDTGAISLGMYSLFTFGIAMWLFYGVALGSMPMILANSITFFLALSILCFKIYHIFSRKYK